MHELHDLFQVILAAAKVRLPYWHLSLSTSAASHLSE